MTEENKSEEEKEEIGLYEKLASRSKEFLDEAREKTSAALDAAVGKAKEEMVAAGDFGHEQGERLKTFLMRDLKASLKDAAMLGEEAKKDAATFSHAAKEALEPHRVRAGIESTLATILEVVGVKFEDWGGKLESRLDCKTGELCSPGTLNCKSCGEKLRMHNTGRIPPCPKCRATEFHKSY
ncbi:MAG: hypothetical protein RQ824_10220 [bacterium]|nr:hypothetical protein [bacterium]